ncbi:hypothetical protein [Novosphingopyxis iocasae]|uniref:hypothetical protein n=1 Tax=Novosphingopyxis iocasae TaxID=2762729 RepID=UPI001650EDBB|nr:hypothetical protein [Novosphingopyxis iocasae]
MEPRDLVLGGDTGVLSEVMRELISPVALPLDRFDDATVPPVLTRYDLVTFPEAFATPSAVLAVAEAISPLGPSGCLHFGLRPDEPSSGHLFDTTAVRSLVERFTRLTDSALGDLDGFVRWLDDQPPDGWFNIGCVLAVDADSKLRVCLHPKLIRSKFEVDTLPERHMSEANLLCLVTLQPRNARFGTITMQPLICSDALSIGSDRGLATPIAAITRHADCIPDPPNHVDVVSVATCTPQPEGRRLDGSRFREWHLQFLDAFRDAAEHGDCARHHLSSFVLANYTEIGKGLGGGLSGAFLPLPPVFKRIIPTVSVSCWGRHAKEPKPNNAWSGPDDDALTSWSSLGFVAGLDPFAVDPAATARIFAFDLHRLPRERSRWRSEGSIVSLRITELHTGSGRMNETNPGVPA